MNLSTSVTTNTIKAQSQFGPVITGIGGYNAYDVLDINAWRGQYPNIIVVSSIPYDEDGAVRVIRSKGQVPTLAEGVRNYILRIPGNNPVCLTNLGVRFTDKLPAILKHADDNRMERTWGAYATDGSGIKAVWMTATALGYMMNDIPSSMPIVGVEWLGWVHNWTKSHLFEHRYFDATNMGVLEAIPSSLSQLEAPVDTEAPKAEELAVKPTETPVVAKRKPGRPRKVNGSQPAK